MDEITIKSGNTTVKARVSWGTDGEARLERVMTDTADGEIPISAAVELRNVIRAIEKARVQI